MVAMLWRAVCLKRESGIEGQAMSSAWRSSALHAANCLPVLMGACPGAWTAAVGAVPAESPAECAAGSQPCTLAEALVGSSLLHGNNRRWAPIREACSCIPVVLVETARVVRR